MIKNKFENILCCPTTGNDLSLLTGGQVEQLNEKIAQGFIRNIQGERHTTLVQAAFKVKDQDVFYLVEEDIFYLLSDCALLGENAQEVFFSRNAETKNQVKQFYDQTGWQVEAGIYQDAKDSEDLREVAQEYILRCHLRLNQYLPKRGKYLLDVASGPVQYPAYLTYSKDFQYRICADISMRALREARNKLGNKGIYLLCDVTRLPLKSNQIDAVVSLHTLYHVPKSEQAKAYAELYRVLSVGGKSVVVYSWGSRSLFMNCCLFPLKLYCLIGRQLRRKAVKNPENTLYFYAHGYRWFQREIKTPFQAQLFSWRSVNVPFLKVFVHPKLGGKQLLKAIFWLENHAHYLMGRIGAYPLFVSKKSSLS